MVSSYPFHANRRQANRTTATIINGNACKETGPCRRDLVRVSVQCARLKLGLGEVPVER